MPKFSLVIGRPRRSRILILVVAAVVLNAVLYLRLLFGGTAFKKEGAPSFAVVNRNIGRIKPKPVLDFKASSYRDRLLFLNSSSDLSALSDNMTVVTAYFNIGNFFKGQDDLFGPDLYYRWMTVFSRITNPVVAYFDTDNDAEYFRIVRNAMPNHMTRIVKLDRNNLWAFKLMPLIEIVFGQSWYPRHHPNTVKADYCSAMHSKYELVQRTLQENPFRTRYFCWLDIGLFREIIPASPIPSVSSGPPFQLSLPPGFDENRIAYTEVEMRSEEMDLEKIITWNRVWVCGCFFVGRIDVLFRWTVEYMEGMEKMLERQWMSTDQQVIYWIYNEGLHTTWIQTYREKDGEYNSWFYLGYLSKNSNISSNSHVSHSAST